MLAKGVQKSIAANSFKSEINDIVFFFRFVMLSDSLCLMKMTRDVGKDADEGTQVNTAKYANRGSKSADRFVFSFDPNTLGVTGRFVTSDENKSRAEAASKNLLAIEEKAHSGMLTPVSGIGGLGSFNQMLSRFTKDVLDISRVDYSEGVATMRLIDGGKIVEVFQDDNLSDDEMEKKGLNYGIGRRDKKKEELNGPLQNSSALQRFQELKDKQNMKKAVNQLGRSNYFAYKITAISIKLVINVSAGILFYILIIGLFEVLEENLFLFSSISVTATSLIQTSYLSMEKILWNEGRLSFNAYEPSMAAVFSELDSRSVALLKSVESKIIQSSNLVDSVKLSVSTDLWYRTQFFKLYRLGQTKPALVNAKEGLSSLLSNALVHLSKPLTYYNRNNKDLHVFFQNCREGLFDAVKTFLSQVNEQHSLYSSSRQTLLLTLLLGKIGLGCIFITIAFVLYFKENKRKEEVIALFYSFSPSDVKWLLQVNEKLMSVILMKDFKDNDSGLEHSKLIEYRESEKAPVANEEFDDEQSRQIMMAKRNKSRGRLDRLVDFNKFFIVFFAFINTMYFVFLYFWNLDTYGEYWGLMRFSKSNDLLSLQVNSRFNRMMHVLYSPMNGSTFSHNELNEDIAQYNTYRKECLFELLGNKYSASTTFNNLYQLFFSNGCEYLPNRKEVCSSILNGEGKRGYFMIETRFMADISVFNRYQLYLQEYSTVQTPPWIFATEDSCSQAMVAQGSYSSQDAWNCFLRAKDVEDIRKLLVYRRPDIQIRTRPPSNRSNRQSGDIRGRGSIKQQIIQSSIPGDSLVVNNTDAGHSMDRHTHKRRQRGNRPSLSSAGCDFF